MSLVLYLKRTPEGPVVIADRAIRCDHPDCGTLRNVSEFRDHYETMRFLPDWQYLAGEHRCSEHWRAND